MPNDLDALFQPRSIAVAGASPDTAKWGFRYFQALVDQGFSGDLHPVNPKAQDVLGRKAYASVADIPGTVDFVISTVPTHAALQLMDDCVSKGVRAVHFFTARFSETGHADRAGLEQDILRRAREGGVRILGPNGMGVYCPAQGISFKHLPVEPGPTAFISQSGAYAGELVYTTSLRGLRYSKVVSYGNAIDIDESELLDYLADDPDTSVIGAYLEGVRDGPKFVQVLKRAAAKKPVALLKGGASAAGAKAVASHTASLAGSREVWEALARQTGAVLAQHLEELSDLLIAFRFCPPATGTRVGVVGAGGGRSVESADACEAAGLVVEPIPEEIQAAFRSRDPELWDWIGNPVDGSILAGAGFGEGEILERMATSASYDVLIGNIAEFWAMERPGGDDLFDFAVDDFLKAAKSIDKPLVLVMGDAVGEYAWQSEILSNARRRIVEAGLACFPTVRRAAIALRGITDYYRRRAEVSA